MIKHIIFFCQKPMNVRPIGISVNDDEGEEEAVEEETLNK